MTTEVVTIGEAMLRLSVRPGDRLESAASFEVHVAGAEANVAVALAALGRSVAWVSVLPDNASDVGWRWHSDPSKSTSRQCDGWKVPGSVCTSLRCRSRRDRFASFYDRSGSAASQMTAADLPWQRIDKARVVHVSGITLLSRRRAGLPSRNWPTAYGQREWSWPWV